MRTVNHFVNECTNLNCLPSFLLHRSFLEVRVPLIHLALIISTLEIALANIHWDVLVLFDVADVHQCNKVDFPYLLFLCAFFMTSFHSFSIVAFASAINIAWVERSFIHTSRFPEACVSARVLWAMRDSRFPKFADQNHIRSSYFFLPRFTLERISYSRVTCRILSHTLCRMTRHRVLTSTSKGNQVKSFLRIFSSERILAQSCNKVQNSVLSLQHPKNWICFCLRCFGFSRFLPPHRIFLLGGVSFSKFREIRNDSSLGTQVEHSVQYGDNKWSILEQTKSIPDLLRRLLILQVETLPYRREILRWDSLSLRWIPISEWVLGIRSLFLIILLDHLP